MKKRRIGKYIIVGTFMILTGVVGVSAANTLTSNGVLYSNAGSSVTTVEGALNELYANYNSLLAKGNASASEILSGKTALVGGKEVTGTMPNKSGVLVGLSGYETVTVKPHPMDNSQGLVTIKNQYLDYGYFDSATTFQTNIANLNAANIKAGVAVGQVNGNSSNSIVGTYTSDATANASQILSGQTAYVNGNKITGTMIDRTNDTGTTGLSWAYNASNTYEQIGNQLRIAVSPGYYGSSTYSTWGTSGIVFSDYQNKLGITADKIAAGQTIAGVTGTYTGLSVSGAVVHEKSVSSACGSDYYSTSSISAGTYIVTNMMYTNVGTGSASNMTVYNGATLLSEYKYGSCIVQIYKVVVSSTINSGSSLGRMSNCSYNSNTSSMYGRSTWVKVSA